MNRTSLVVLGCLWSGVVTSAAAGALPVITPAPQQISWTLGKAAWLDVASLDGIRASSSLVVPAAAQEKLQIQLGAALPMRADGNLRIKQEALPDSIPERTRREAYLLEIDESEITLVAEAANGIHYGLVTLMALQDNQNRIPCVTIMDWPDQELRGVYVGSIGQAEEKLDLFSSLKMNLLLLEDGNLFDLDNPGKCERFQQLAQKCHDNYIEFVPELQSLGWGHFVLQREPRAVEARWVERAAFPIRNGRVYSPDPPLPARPVIINPHFETGLQGWKAETHDSHWNPSTPEEVSVITTADQPILQLRLANPQTIRVSQEISLQPDAYYLLSALIKTQEVADTGGAYMEVYGVGATGHVFQIGRSADQIRGSTEWREEKVAFYTGSGQMARPGGAIDVEKVLPAEKRCEKVIIYLRLQDSMGTVWYADVNIVPVQSPNPLANAVVTEAAFVVVEKEDGTIRYEAGRDYTLEVPELHYPYDLGEPLGITVTENSRIRENDTVLLSFNQADRDDITCCPSEPLYDAFLQKSIVNVVEKLNPRYLHIGHDEPRFFNRDKRCTARNLTHTELFADTIKRVREAARQANPDIRIMMWDDAINPFQNAPHLDTVGVAETLPRDIIINVWWYDNTNCESQIDKSLEYFMGLGFDVTGSPWFRIPNARHWVKAFHGLKHNPQARGIIYTSWDMVPRPWAALEFTAEHSWSFNKPVLQQP